MNFLDKLDYMLKEKNMNKRQLSQATGIPYTTIDSFYKKGYDNIKLSTLLKLSDYFQCSLDYLVDDDNKLVSNLDLIKSKTDTLKNVEKSSNYIKMYALNTLSKNEHLHIKMYRKLDKIGKDIVDFVTKKEYERVDSKTLETEAIKPTKTIPFYPRLASAGPGEYLFDDIPSQVIALPVNECTEQADFAIGVNGDSMEPLFHDGDSLLIKKQVSIELNEAGIFIIDGNAFVKILDKDSLVSYNPKYPPIIFREGSDIKCIGKVITRVGDYNEPDEDNKDNEIDMSPEELEKLLEEYYGNFGRFAAFNGVKDDQAFKDKIKAFSEFMEGKDSDNL